MNDLHFMGMVGWWTDRLRGRPDPQIFALTELRPLLCHGFVGGDTKQHLANGRSIIWGINSMHTGYVLFFFFFSGGPQANYQGLARCCI